MHTPRWRITAKLLPDTMSFKERVSCHFRMSAIWKCLSTYAVFGGTSGSSVTATLCASRYAPWLVGQTNNSNTNWIRCWQSSARSAKALCGLTTTQGFLFLRLKEKLRRQLLCRCEQRVLGFALKFLLFLVHQFR